MPRLGVIDMIQVSSDAYAEMLGSIDAKALITSVKCVSQCTGCMCNCRCSCSGGLISDFEWEEL
ncbi:hypothetical protein HMPREF9069_01782 [Atopobium sp. oral taxon 810 str. F0209]|nr:hypothetical protein HMPREF9069_01782 [Atopobium sp. oral taxon 810 str. F0209]